MINVFPQAIFHVVLCAYVEFINDIGELWVVFFDMQIDTKYFRKKHKHLKLNI